MIEYALLGIFSICSLTSSEPYYNCNEMWNLVVYENNNGEWCSEFKTASCARWDSDTIYLDMDRNFWFDDDGRFSLQHEIDHMKCQCSWHT
jgi:hypothetical protein